MKTAEYIETAIKATGVTSEYALAKRMKLAQARLSAWKAGREWPDNEACTKLAQAIGINPMEVIADIEEQKAKTPEKAAYWRQLKTVDWRRGWDSNPRMPCDIA